MEVFFFLFIYALHEEDEKNEFSRVEIMKLPSWHRIKSHSRSLIPKIVFFSFSAFNMVLANLLRWMHHIDDKLKLNCLIFETKWNLNYLQLVLWTSSHKSGLSNVECEDKFISDWIMMLKDSKPSNLFRLNNNISTAVNLSQVKDYAHSYGWTGMSTYCMGNISKITYYYYTKDRRPILPSSRPNLKW